MANGVWRMVNRPGLPAHSKSRNPSLLFSYYSYGKMLRFGHQVNRGAGHRRHAAGQALPWYPAQHERNATGMQ